jgi:hypothetical protein
MSLTADKALGRIADALEKISLPKEQKNWAELEDVFIAAAAYSVKDGNTFVVGVTKYQGKEPILNSRGTNKTPYEAEKAMLGFLKDAANALGLLHPDTLYMVSNIFLTDEMRPCILLSAAVRDLIENEVNNYIRLLHSE